MSGGQSFCLASMSFAIFISAVAMLFYQSKDYPVMARYPNEWEEVFTRIHSPHRRTRACKNGGRIQVSRNVSFIPSLRARRNISSRIVEETTFQDCYCDCHRHIGGCSCGMDSGESLFQFPTTYVKKTTTLSTDSTHSMLNRWFKRYMNDDGYLGQADLTKLVQNLGGSMDKGPIKKALKEADADGDNQLSFREFLQMWHQAASHESDFLDATGCQDIVDIVNEHDLFPDVSCKDCDRHRYNFGKNDRQEQEDQTICNCGSEKDITPFERPDETTGGSAVIKTADGKWPLFSCNRLPACIPKNWRE